MELIGQIQNGGSLNGSFGYDSGDYELLSHKPQINGVTLVGNKTSADLHIEGGGTDDYNDLDNKPMINGVQLSGNKTPEELGLAEIIYPEDPTLYLNGSGEFTEPDYFSGNYNDLASKPQINGVVVEGYLNTSDLLIDYDDLSGRPQINGSTLTGNQTAEDLGLEPEIAYPGDATKYLNGEGNFTTPDYFSGDYDDLTDKPQINGVTLSGDKSTSDLLIDYDDLSGRPQINGITLSGNKTADDLGLATKGEIKEASGSVLHFTDGIDVPDAELIIYVNFIWGGSGIPMPDNIRTITPIDTINVYVNDDGTTDTPNYTFNLPGEVYKGYINYTKGEAVITHNITIIDENNNITSIADLGNNVRFWSNLGSGFKTAPEADEIYSNCMPASPRVADYQADRVEFRPFTAEYPTSGWFKLPKDLIGTTAASIKSYLQDNPIVIVAPLDTPQTLTLNKKKIQILEGENYIQADTGDMTLKYITNINDPVIRYILNNL